MAAHKTKSKKAAMLFAARMRRKGFDVTIYKLKQGYGISVTR